MYKRVCTACGVPNMVLSQAKADKTWPCHHCGTALGPELNQRIGEDPLPAAPAKAPTHNVGDTTESGHTILANYKNQVILAVSGDPHSPEPYVVWNLSERGVLWGGSYRKAADRAEREFAERCFPWVRPDKCEPMAGVVIDISETNKNAGQRRALAEGIKKFGFPDQACLDNPGNTDDSQQFKNTSLMN